VKLIRARLGLHQHRRAAAPELRREGVGQHLKFLDRADIDALPVLILRRVIIVHTVNLKGRGARAEAIEGSVRTSRVGRIVLSAAIAAAEIASLETGNLLDQ